MSSTDRASTGTARLRRRLAAALAVIAVAVPGAGLFTLLEQTRVESVRFVEAERDGVAYLRALVPLLAATADAQGAAVAGDEVDDARLTETRTDVDSANARIGDRLGVDRRWDDVSAALDTAYGSGTTGAAAYDEWSRALDLQMALVAEIYDSSNLVLDPQIDSYYVARALAETLPGLLVTSGRIADLTRIAGGHSHEDPGLTDEQQTAAGGAEKRRADFATEAADLDRGLRIAVSGTRSATLGPTLLGRVDRLRDAATQLAPSADAFGVEVDFGDVATVAGYHGLVRDAAVSLAAAAATELDLLLAARLGRLSDQSRWALTFLGLAALLLAGAGWLASPSRSRTGTGSAPDDPGRLAPDALDPASGPGLLDPEELLAARRLVRSGRSLSASRDER